LLKTKNTKPANRNTGKKSNDAEFQKRIGIVTDMLLSGLTRGEILQNGSSLDWNVSDRSIDEYISKARVVIDELGRERADMLYTKVITRLNYMYKKLVNVKDYKGAAGVLDKIADVAGLKVNKVLLATKEEVVITIGPTLNQKK